MKRANLLAYRDLAEYTEQGATATRSSRMEEALAHSPENRQRLRRIQTVATHLGDLDAVNDIDLLPGLKVRLAATAPAPARSRRRWASPRWIGLTIAVAGIAIGLPTALLRTRNPTHRPDSEFRAKMASPQRDARSRWIAINAFRLSGEAAPEPLHDTLHVDDGLLFSYTNLGPTPFSSLMIFGLDDDHRVYWYYPAFLDARDNPRSIDIQKGGSRVALREVVAHPYREGTLTLFGVFSDQSLSVSEVEDAVRRGVRDGAALERAFDGVRVKIQKVEIIP